MTYLIDLLRRSRLVQLWAPVFVWMAGIFYFSSRSHPLGFLPSPQQRGPIGKVAHFVEYAGLAALLYRALREQGGGRAGEQRSPSACKQSDLRTGRGAGEQGSEGDFSSVQKHLITSALIALAYAFSDEIHQELAPGRGFELADIGYDLVGIIVALGMIWLRERGAE